jgi:hypothetical protein
MRILNRYAAERSFPTVSGRPNCSQTHAARLRGSRVRRSSWKGVGVILSRSVPFGGTVG